MKTLVTPKLIGVLIAVLASFAATSGYADSLLSVKRTPYDRQMTRIQPYLQASASSKNSPPSVSLVNEWIGSLRSIPYGFSQTWKTPEEVATSPAADCKGKAVMLYRKMQASGAKGLRLVIGKRSISSRSTHAWVEWSTPQGTYLLDPTINWTAYKMEKFTSNEYIAAYAYSGSRKFRVVSSALVAQN